MLAALGVVFGDLGTSPLYTLQTVVQAMDGQVTHAGALGALSLIVWTLIITISIKYCRVVMRADNKGEGGILALMSLIGANGPGLKAFTVMGLLGAALIYGDGVITPAISVLSAVEGVNVATNAFKPYVMPAAVLILVCAVRQSALWNRAHRAGIRAGDAALVHRDRASGSHLDRPPSRGADGARSQPQRCAS